MHEEISLMPFVIPGLTRNSGLFRIPVEDTVCIGTSAGMTEAVMIKDTRYRTGKSLASVYF
jgi:hypothetical protein